MKNKIISIVLLSICIFSCKKNCINKDVKADLSGKVKSIKQYNLITSDTIKYFLFYDSIKGNLKIVKNDSMSLYSIISADEHTVLFYNYETGFTYRIALDGQQIKGIYKLNTIKTTVSLKDSKVDSIHDEGDYFNYNISYHNIDYHNQNWDSYSVNYTLNFLNILYNKQYNVRLVYTNIINNTKIMAQSIGQLAAFPDVSTNLPEITYFLGLNDGYLFKPNKYLLDSVITTETPNSYIKYNYIFDNNEILKVIQTSPNGTSVKEYTYY